MTESLKPYRKEIDEIDNKIIDLLQRRFEIFKEVATVKANHGLPITQPERVQEVLERVSTMAHSKNLPVELIHNFYSAMIDEAHRIENNIKDALQKEKQE